MNFGIKKISGYVINVPQISGVLVADLLCRVHSPFALSCSQNEHTNTPADVLYPLNGRKGCKIYELR